jgi:hypothetical protein
MFTRATQCMRGVLDPPVSPFSLSLYRHPFLYTLFSSRFTLILNNNTLPSLGPQRDSLWQSYQVLRVSSIYICIYIYIYIYIYSSLSYAHRSMAFFHNQTLTLAVGDFPRPIDYSVSDSRVVFGPTPTPCSWSSFSHPHRSMVFFRNQTSVLPVADSVRPIDYRVSDIRVSSTPGPTPPIST